jgi:hypothetical protein
MDTDNTDTTYTFTIHEIYRKCDSSLFKTAHFLSQFNINIDNIDDDTIINTQYPQKHDKSKIPNITSHLTKIKFYINHNKIKQEPKINKCCHTMDSGPNIGTLCGRNVNHNQIYCGYHNRS